jgi:hypothetical protein
MRLSDGWWAYHGDDEPIGPFATKAEAARVACKHGVRSRKLFRLPLNDGHAPLLGFLEAHAPCFFRVSCHHEAGRGAGGNLPREDETFF